MSDPYARVRPIERKEKMRQATITHVRNGIESQTLVEHEAVHAFHAKIVGTVEGILACKSQITKIEIVED
jgi:hypothetical protein